ncbi:PASTA domain containing protein [Chloroherpeton thalassium ATCC 35110]|uniref:PASTA domain containing protein n=1 Tax=Chloroherpeton thalassium (strain ATCC 35110 / GB-78) TaxID=517418 RepID=B3QX24_CHLT3|nr:PASTA domain-containing protein [Chloroherpeton thalassium]ACF14834.1 PASTA domain containing protein [Chloroherpeton thalassium ATCC 35110]
MGFKSDFLTSKVAIQFYVTIFLLFTLAVLFDKVVMPFYVKGGDIVKVPEVAGLDFEAAKSTLLKANLEPRLGYSRYDERYQLNAVLSQNPQAGEKVKAGRHVYLSVNTKNQPPSPLPDLRGRTLADATLSLERIGLSVGTVTYSVVYKEDEDGIVLSQSVPPNALLKAGTPVSFSIGKMAEEDGEKQSLIPDVTGRSLSEAQKLIVSSGYSLGKVSFRYSVALVPNTIIEQNPKQGEVAPLGKPIDISVVTDDKSKASD